MDPSTCNYSQGRNEINHMVLNTLFAVPSRPANKSQLKEIIITNRIEFIIHSESFCLIFTSHLFLFS